MFTSPFFISLPSSGALEIALFMGCRDELHLQEKLPTGKACFPRLYLHSRIEVELQMRSHAHTVLSRAGRKAGAGIGAFCIPMVCVLTLHSCAAGTFTAIANEAAVIKGNDAVIR